MSVQMSERTKGKVLSILTHSPQTTAKELSEVLGVTHRQCERILDSMKKKGIDSSCWKQLEWTLGSVVMQVIT